MILSFAVLYGISFEPPNSDFAVGCIHGFGDFFGFFISLKSCVFPHHSEFFGADAKQNPAKKLDTVLGLLLRFYWIGGDVPKQGIHSECQRNERQNLFKKIVCPEAGASWWMQILHIRGI